MTDQVSRLNKLVPRFNQIGRPPTAPGSTPGAFACTDNEVAEIIRREKGIAVSAAQVRVKTDRRYQLDRGLTPNNVLQALLAFGVKGYNYHSSVTPSEVLKATDNGVVLLGVGYRLYPRQRGEAGPGPEAEVGGKTDMPFHGAHAVSLWGRRYWAKPPANWPAHVTFKPGWRVWLRDPDHRQDYTVNYDRFRAEFLGPAMTAIKEDRWTTTFAIYKGQV